LAIHHWLKNGTQLTLA